MHHSYWAVFLLTAILLNITPGPDMIYLITQSMSYGKRVGFASVLGLGAGAIIHTLFVSLGISAIISTSIVVFRIMKLVGASYLFYLGIKALLFGEIDLTAIEKRDNDVSFMRSFLNALVIDVTNPKVALFFAALLPQFYRNNGTPRTAQFLFLGVVIVLIGFVIESVIVVLSEKIADVLRRKPIVSKVIDKLFGTVLIGLGVKLVLEERS